MPEKYKNRYRISSIRLRNWDYSRNAAYFVTICTKNRKHFFGKIINGEMHLNEIGIIAKKEWSKTPEIQCDMNLELDEFVIMPDHFHAIIIIGKNDFNTPDGYATHGVSSKYATHGVSKFGPQSKNLASIIRGFKSSVTVQARLIRSDFAWQTRFYEHIIQNDEARQRIRKYIVNNPLMW